MNHRPEHYVAILAWGRRLNSGPGYIADEQLRAALDGAPLDALFPQLNHAGSRSGRWVCISHLPPDSLLRAQLEEFLNHH